MKPCTELSGYTKVSILINIAVMPQTYGVYLKTANKLPRVFRHLSATNISRVFFSCGCVDYDKVWVGKWGQHSEGTHCPSLEGEANIFLRNVFKYLLQYIAS